MKVILWILAILVLAVAGFGGYLYLNSGALLKSAIEEYGSEAAGVAVRVGDVSLDLAEGSGEIRGLTVANPAEFGGGNVMEVGLTRLGLNVAESTEQVVVLNELVVDGAVLNVIAKGKRTNLEALQEQVEAGEASTSSSSGSSATDEPKIIVDRLRIQNTQANLDSDLLGETALKVPDVALNKVGRAEGGITFEELAERIVSPITRDVTKELVNKGLGLDKAKEKAEEKVRAELDRGLKKLTDRLRSRD